MFSLFFSILSLLSTFANEPAQVNASHSFSNTSNGLKTKTYSITYETNRRDLFWKYQDFKPEAYDLIFGAVITDAEYLGEITGKKIFSGMARKWNENNYSRFKLGLHNLEYSSSDSSTVFADFTQRLIFGKHTLEFNTNYDFLYTSGGVPGPYNDKLQRLQTKLSGTYRPKDYMRVPFELEYTKISSGNSLQRQSVSTLFGRAYPVWIWAGYRFERLSYDHIDVGYWSPEKFISHGPLIEWGQTFYEKYSFKASYLYSFIKENDGESGNSYYASAAFEYGERNSMLFGMSVFRNKSIQNSSEWWSEGGELYFKYSF
ncbi:hypothetical protein [Halobacteriovorax sp.]|uniref:hypothetical protein n=1 Tax=Halobacteriovorax sp. TaxID=2020862 RepID=UPI003562471A